MKHRQRLISQVRCSERTSGRRLARGTACLLLIAGVCALMVPGLASAAGSPSALSDPTSAQYSTSINVSGGDPTPSSGDPTPSTRSSGLQKHVVGGLPFTGVDLLALAAIAVALTSAGFALRRLSAPRYRA